MKIDDKEIDKLLEGFEGEDIKVPQILDDKLNNKLEELKPRKSKKVLKTIIASILIMIISYTTIPSFKTFADNVFKYIFGDVGLENAINNGYESIPNQTIDIAGYKMDIENIYMDNLRISFDTIIKNTRFVQENERGENSNQYSLYINTGKLGNEIGSISVDNGLFYNEDKKLKANVQLIGDGVEDILKKYKDELTLELKLVRHYNIDVNGEYELKDEILGSTNITLDLPSNLQKSKVININKTINDKSLRVDIQKLEVSPTMMYLDTKGIIDKEYETNGLYNFKIVSENNNLYKENMSLSALGKENGIWRQTVVPSIYYDDSKSFKLKADGVLVNNKEEMKIKIDDNYPKEIKYFDSRITIKNVYYKKDRLVVEFIGNDKVAYAGSSLLNGKEGNETYFMGDKVYGFVFEAPKKDSYNFTLEMIMKYELPIDININK